MTPVIDITLTSILLVWLGVLCVLAVQDRRRGRRPGNGFLILTGLLAGTVEALYDALIDFTYFPAPDAVIVYSAFGRDIPLWVVLAYTVCIATVGRLTLALLHRGATPMRLRGLLVGWALFDLTAEAAVRNLGGYTYRGGQPYALFGIPYVWPLVYAASFLAIGLTVSLLSRRVSGLWWITVLPLGGAMMIGSLLVTSFPTLIGIRRGIEVEPASLYGVVTLLMTFGLLEILLRAACRHAHRPAHPVRPAPEPSHGQL